MDFSKCSDSHIIYKSMFFTEKKTCHLGIIVSFFFSFLPSFFLRLSLLHPPLPSFFFPPGPVLGAPESGWARENTWVRTPSCGLGIQLPLKMPAEGLGHWIPWNSFSSSRDSLGSSCELSRTLYAPAQAFFLGAARAWQAGISGLLSSPLHPASPQSSPRCSSWGGLLTRTWCPG